MFDPNPVMKMGVCGLIPICSWGFAFGLWRYRLRLSAGKAALASLCSALVGVGFGAYRFFTHPQAKLYVSEELLFSAVLALLFGLLTPLLMAILYDQWFGRGRDNESRKKPGARGFGAWLRPFDVALCFAIALSASHGLDYPFSPIFALALGSLAAAPILTTLSQEGVPPTRPGDLSAERSRVLGMLDDRKITAEECAELLSALGDSSSRPAARSAAMSEWRRLVLFGASLTLIGFFLPWFQIGPAGKMKTASNQMTGGLLESARNQILQSGNPSLIFSDSLVIYFNGGRIPNGLGVAILILAIGAAAMRHLSTGLGERAKRQIALGALAIGAVMLVYLLADNFRFASIGIVVVAAGYAVVGIGIFKEGQE